MYGKSSCGWCHTAPSMSSYMETVPRRMARGNWKEEGRQRLEGEGASCTRKKAPATPEHLQLLNRVTALKLRRS